MKELDSLPLLSVDLGVQEFRPAAEGPNVIERDPVGILANESTKLLLSIRKSDEDPRQIWKLVTDAPLRLSVAYIVSIRQRQPSP